MRVPVLALLLALAPLLAGCTTDTGGEGQDTKGDAPQSQASTTPGPTTAASATPTAGSQPPAQTRTTPTPAPTPRTPTSLNGLYRIDVEGIRQQVAFRPDGTFTYTQSMEGDSGTWEGTYDLRTGKGRMNDADITVRFVHEDLVSFDQVLVRRVLADGTTARPHAGEVISGSFISRGDRTEEYSFGPDGTWSMTGSLKTMDSFGTWSASGRYSVPEGAMVWDEGEGRGRTAALVWWTEAIVVIDGVAYVQE